MKRILLVVSVISALFLAGCNSNEVMNNEKLSGNKNNQVYEELTDNLEVNDAMIIIENYLNLLAMKEGSYEGFLDFLELVDEVQMDSEKTMLSSNGSEFWKTNIKYDDFKNKLLEYMSLNCFETFSKGFEEKDGYLYTLPLGATGYSYDVYEVNLEEKKDNYYVYTAKAKLNDISDIFETRNIEVIIIKENDRYVVDNKKEVEIIENTNLPESIVQKNEGINEIVKDKKLFYYVGSSLIAIGEKGIIRPVDERAQLNITYRELLSEEFYTAYSLKKAITRKLDKVKLGIYVDENHANDSIESVLISYGEKVGSGEGYLSELRYDVYELDLPVDISNEVLEMDAYHKIGENGYGYLIELDTYDTFVTNANFNINFEQKTENIELSDSVITKIKEYIERNGLTNDVPYFCSNKFVTDLDGDNKKEKVYAIETNIFKEDEFDSNISKTGALSLILIERENEEVEIMFEANIKPFNYMTDLFWENIYGYINELQIFIADIDNDNDKEIIIDAIIKAPEGGSMMMLYSLNNAKYEEVGTSYYGCGN